MGYYVIKKSKPKSGGSLLSAALYGDDSEYYFVLKADNHEVIATSEMYSSKQACETGIASVQKNGPTKDIREDKF